MGMITIIGLGPGNDKDITLSAIEALRNSEVIVGYKYYMRFIKALDLRANIELYESGMREERERARLAISKAVEGKRVSVISSGDPGIYGMASLIYELTKESKIDVEIEVIPGISAFQKAAALLGAPMGHDFCVISMSDLMTPWSLIEKRIKSASSGDFITAIYNPKSHGRYWQLHRLKELFLEERSPQTPVGIVRHAGRDGEEVTITTLGKFDPDIADMFTIVIIGNSQSYEHEGKIITPRGYFRESSDNLTRSKGQDIMIESFRTIEKELNNPDCEIGFKWPLLHAIHTTADFEMENMLRVDDNAIEKIYDAILSGKTRTIVTDVTMVAAGIRKGALKRMNIEVKCYLNDPDITEEAEEKGITRTQAGIRKAVREHPEAIFAFGNAPTALLELCDLTRKGLARPSGIIAAPVGFVHVLESKHAVKTLTKIPKIIVDGRKGGSNLAATLVNSILCFPDAKSLKPGRDV